MDNPVKKEFIEKVKDAEELSDEKLNSVSGGSFFDDCDIYEAPAIDYCWKCQFAKRNLWGTQIIGCSKQS